MMPSLAARLAFFSADARPFFRRNSVAASMSPPFSTRAFLQSIIPAPVASRRLFTVFASTAAAMQSGELRHATAVRGQQVPRGEAVAAGRRRTQQEHGGEEAMRG